MLCTGVLSPVRAYENQLKAEFGQRFHRHYGPHRGDWRDARKLLAPRFEPKHFDHAFHGMERSGRSF